jgi:hypothetical protein
MVSPALLPDLRRTISVPVVKSQSPEIVAGAFTEIFTDTSTVAALVKEPSSPEIVIFDPLDKAWTGMKS